MPVSYGNNKVLAYDGSQMTIDNALYANNANYASNAGACGWADMAGSVSSLDLSGYSGNIGGVWSPAGSFYGTIGDSDHWISNAFVDNIEAGKIWADEYFVCYTGMSLPDPAPCGTICYSRHAGGHFYGMTDAGWKQLDS